MYHINGEGIGFMAAKKDYAAMCSAIVSACGGEQNIANVAHCMTRLRLQLKDASTFDEGAAKAVSGVIGLVVQNGEYQFVIGQDVPSLYEEFLKIEGIAAGGSVDDPQAARSTTRITEVSSTLSSHSLAERFPRSSRSSSPVV